MQTFSTPEDTSEKPKIAYFPYLDYDSTTNTYYIPDFMKERDSLYLNRINDNGGEVLNLSFTSPLDVLTNCDGLLIPGGLDIDPILYHQRRDPRTWVHELGLQRAEMEKKIIDYLPKDIPILGICYGVQILNVFAGGTLNQHVDNHKGGVKHEISIEKDSKLYELIGEEKMFSHCNHHQIVDVLGKNIKVNCRDVNGMIHGIESTEEDTWVVAIQWHPERSNDELNSRIFKGFMEKCRMYRQKKTQERFEKSPEFWLYF